MNSIARIYTLTIFLSAFLLFLIQPITAKILLPTLGGAPAVWNMAMMFYQTLLLVGYVYAYLGLVRVKIKTAVMIHLALLLVAMASIPISTYVPQIDPALAPIRWILTSLTVSIALPYFILSASAPLLQGWFTHTSHKNAHNPYFLYSASNAGSLLALLSFPLVVEPFFPSIGQENLWSALFILFAGMIAACSFLLFRYKVKTVPAKKKTEKAPTGPLTSPTWRDRFFWLILSFAPASLLFSSITYMTTDLVSFPLLWVGILAIYLLTFVLAFAKTMPLYERSLAAEVTLITAVAVFYMAKLENAMVGFYLLHPFALFAVGLVCHGQLSLARPHSKFLGEYYIWIALGGALAGMANTLLFPVIFSSVLEYPLTLILACFLRPIPKKSGNDSYRKDVLAALGFLGLLLLLCHIPSLISGNPMIAAFDKKMAAISGQVMTINMDRIFLLIYILAGVGACTVSHQRPLRFALVITAIFFTPLLYHVITGKENNTVLQQRNFFGVVKVAKDEVNHAYLFAHGTTLHGLEPYEGKDRLKPQAYYTPLNDLFGVLPADKFKQPAALIGLGVGMVPCFGGPNQRFDLFEINPLVVDIANDTRYFTYMRDCPPKKNVVLGDARLSMSHIKNPAYGIIVLDPFSSDSIPTHLLTREAIAMYLQKLRPDGVMAFNISNRNLNLVPVVAALAKDAGLEALYRDARVVPEGKPLIKPSQWVLMAHNRTLLNKVKARNNAWKFVSGVEGIKPWTDNYSPVLNAIIGTGEVHFEK